MHHLLIPHVRYWIFKTKTFLNIFSEAFTNTETTSKIFMSYDNAWTKIKVTKSILLQSPWSRWCTHFTQHYSSHDNPVYDHSIKTHNPAHDTGSIHWASQPRPKLYSSQDKLPTSNVQRVVMKANWTGLVLLRLWAAPSTHTPCTSGSVECFSHWCQ